MSFEAYVNHILQKYRLAISLAVIKTKPENISLEDHIQQLKNKINEDNMEVDNLTICSDDFLIDEINDFDVNINQNNDNNDQNDDIFNPLNDNHIPCTEHVVEINDTQETNTNFDKTIIPESQKKATDQKNETSDTKMTDAQDLNESITILENFDIPNETNRVMNERNNLDDVMEVLRGIDNNMVTIEKAVSSKIPSKSTREDFLAQLPEEIDITQCFTDNDATQCEKQDISSSADILSQGYIYNSNEQNQRGKPKDGPVTDKWTKDLLKQHPDGIDDIQPFTDKDATQCESLNISASVEILTQEYSYNLNGENQIGKTNCGPKTEKRTELTVGFAETNVNKIQCADKIAECQNSTSNLKTKSRNDSQKVNTDLKKHKLNKCRHTKEFKNIYKNVADIFDSKNKKNLSKDVKGKRSNKKKAMDKLKNSEDVLNHNMTQNFTCNTHYSQSQSSDAIVIDHKYIQGIKRNSNLQNEVDVIEPTIHKKKKEDIAILEHDLINDSNKEVIKMKDINNEVNTFLPEINFAKTPTEKANVNQNLIMTITNDNPVNKASETIVLMSNFITPTSSQKLNQNNEETFNYSQENSAVSNNVNFNNDGPLRANSMKNANDSRINEYVTIYADSSLYANDILPNAQNRFQNSSIINTITPDSCSQNAKSKVEQIDKNLFSEDSQTTTLSYSTDTFQNYMSDDSLGFSHNFGTKNYRKANNETTISNICSKFDYSFKNTPVSNLRTNHYDNLQNIEATVNDRNEHDNTSVDIRKTVSQKSCANFDNNFNTMEVGKDVENTEIEKHKNKPTESCTNSDDNLDLEEVTDSEKIPFKIIEELNKVKMFLSRRLDKNSSLKGYSSDTGYRSDSSSRNSQKLSQSSGPGLDQSAHSLFNYITECSVTSNNESITEEISLALGQLVNKLHEEEKYPTFLEDMLQSIQVMLELIYQHPTDDIALTKKDESIHRIVLLTHSEHIQKYTIEKITLILENLHTELTTDESFEIQNIEKIENACYIFHLLEIILLKHNKTKQNLSQDTQNLSQSTQNLSQSTQNLSQNTQEDEKMLKKSNIMDIWRKKWNPNYKESQNEGSQEKKCVLSNCSTVLNKLIVGCMEGYSLISYFALKCFNAMQE